MKQWYCSAFICKADGLASLRTRISAVTVMTDLASCIYTSPVPEGLTIFEWSYRVCNIAVFLHNTTNLILSILYIVRLVQERRNSLALAMGFCLSCNNLSKHDLFISVIFLRKWFMYWLSLRIIFTFISANSLYILWMCKHGIMRVNLTSHTFLKFSSNPHTYIYIIVVTIAMIPLLRDQRQMTRWTDWRTWQFGFIAPCQEPCLLIILEFVQM